MGFGKEMTGRNPEWAVVDLYVGRGDLCTKRSRSPSCVCGRPGALAGLVSLSEELDVVHRSEGKWRAGGRPASSVGRRELELEVVRRAEAGDGCSVARGFSTCELTDKVGSRVS